MKEKPILLTVKQVAEQLQIEEQTVWRYIRTGQLHAVKLGRYYRISPADLQEFLKKHRVQPEQPSE